MEQLRMLQNEYCNIHMRMVIVDLLVMSMYSAELIDCYTRVTTQSSYKRTLWPFQAIVSYGWSLGARKNDVNFDSPPKLLCDISIWANIDQEP